MIILARLCLLLVFLQYLGCGNPDPEADGIAIQADSSLQKMADCAQNNVKRLNGESFPLRFDGEGLEKEEGLVGGFTFRMEQSPWSTFWISCLQFREGKYPILSLKKVERKNEKGTGGGLIGGRYLWIVRNEQNHWETASNTAISFQNLLIVRRMG